MAEDLGFSLGKLNYCLKALKDKGYVKINNFKKKDKINYIQYILTPEGIAERTKLTINFMKRKMKEYDDLKKELENVDSNKFNKDQLSFLKSELKNKFGKDFKFYCPKIIIEKFKNNKLVKKECNLLGDYLFCFNDVFKEKITKQLNNIKGVKYF